MIPSVQLRFQITIAMTSWMLFLSYVLPMIQTFTFCLVLTIVVELLVARLLGIKNKQELLIIIAAQIFTNPIAVFITSACIDWTADSAQYYGCIVAVELAVIIVEGLIYKLKGVSSTPWRFSILCNLASVSVGILIQTLI